MIELNYFLKHTDRRKGSSEKEKPRTLEARGIFKKHRRILLGIKNDGEPVFPAADDYNLGVG